MKLKLLTAAILFSNVSYADTVTLCANTSIVATSKELPSTQWQGTLSSTSTLGQCSTPPPPPSGSCVQGSTGDVPGYTATCMGAYQLHSTSGPTTNVGNATSPMTFPYEWGSVFVASISTNTMNVTSFSRGNISVGDPVYATGVAAGTVITKRVSGFGGVGVYNINTPQTLSARAMTSGDWPGSVFGPTDVFSLPKNTFISVPFKPTPGHTINFTVNGTYTTAPVTFSVSTASGLFNNASVGNGVVCYNDRGSIVISSNGSSSTCNLDPNQTYWFNVIVAKHGTSGWYTGCATATCSVGITIYKQN